MLVHRPMSMGSRSSQDFLDRWKVIDARPLLFHKKSLRNLMGDARTIGANPASLCSQLATISQFFALSKPDLDRAWEAINTIGGYKRLDRAIA